MLSFYPQFWTRAFDFEGRTSRIDYWKIFAANLILGLLLSRLAPSAVYVFFCSGLDLSGVGDEHSAHPRHRAFLDVDFHRSSPVHRLHLVALD